MFSSKTSLADMQAIRAALLGPMTDPAALPIRFRLDGVLYHGIPAEWKTRTLRKIVDANIVQRDYIARIPGTGLTLRVECQEYKDFPVWEWTAYFDNDGEENSPVISDFCAIDAVLPTGDDALLYHNNGDYCSRDGLETTERALVAGEVFTAASVNGRSCDRAWPYYRITDGTLAYNIAIGWPGNWQAWIEKAEGGVRVQAKQQYTNFYLKPGETARSPRMVVMALAGDNDRAINMWRRWYFEHCLPRTRGDKLTPKVCYSHGGGGEEFTLATEENQKDAIATFIKRGEVPDIWWIDAGWYPCKDENGVKRWVRTGKWYPDPEKFPRGLGPVGQMCDENGIQLLLWFEPERVMLKYWTEENPDEYVLKLQIPANNDWLDSNGLLDLGSEQCRQWLTDMVKKVMADGHVKVYRQDFNGDPFPLNWWLQNDLEENRSGITENKHIQGYLRYWDDLLMDTPDLWIDSCASGGRRNDIEAMRRAVALHPTDYGYGEHPVKQAFQKTWYEWTPYFRSIPAAWDDEDGNYGTGKPHAHGFDFYTGHCALGPATAFGAGAYSDEKSFALASAFHTLLKRAMPLTLHSDFFCLTPVRKSNEDFFAIQFNRETEREGMIQVIRNTRCEQESITVLPKGLDENAVYELEAPEIGKTLTLSGKELMEEGFTVSIPKRSGIFWFYRAKQA